MERDARGHRKLSPAEWIWFWRIGMAILGPAAMLIGFFGDPRQVWLICLGFFFEVLGIFMLGFWRQVLANRAEQEEPASDSN